MGCGWDVLRGNVAEPKAEYERRLEKYLKVIAEKDRVHLLVGYAKLAVIAVGLLLLWSVFAKHLLIAYWLTAPIGAYGLLTILHGRVLRAKNRANTAAEFCRGGIARIEDRWAGGGQTGERFRDAHHVYAEDLDLFGRGCLFELLSTARLPMGESRLASWLCAGSERGAILERQKLIEELREKVDLREALAVTGEDLKARLNPESMMEWAEGTSILPRGAWRVVMAMLALGVFAEDVYLDVDEAAWFQRVEAGGGVGVGDDGDLYFVADDGGDGEADALDGDGALWNDVTGEGLGQKDSETPVGVRCIWGDGVEGEEGCGSVDMALDDVASERRAGRRGEFEVNDGVGTQVRERGAGDGLGG